ncbi:MaoC family dehydratase N-terminal domain-containing protein [Ramlibacter tataouinensis]|uniref:FAS1-like dehydratase domain-containing protein n=1 Tax=Ramlibacter tataouinensis TaxID=94132 RepID=UPI0022F3B3EA|nr:MaoC family dehydratase N-terminal domain-containing protein [Ramlibacter tataouinensis]WBY02027.1 MaoC family dehydratase N-terminal domain-containing protein [Ramlibacter tataouinensis]
MSAPPSATAIDPQTLSHLQSWVGRTETLDDAVTPVPIRALSATLDLPAADATAGTALPPLWHWLYFLPLYRQSELGADGHARLGGFLPPVPLPRRMWAGGRLQWEPGNPLVVGDAIRRVSRIASVAHKAGRSGDLLFVLVRHEIHNAQGLALTEEHDIVYRALPQPGDPTPDPVAAPQQAAWQQQVEPDPVLLFRFSALTFNGHRIHYDRRHVTEVEGYPGLVVHGPLIATLLAGLVRRHAPQRFMRRFEFKAVRPTFDLHPFRVMGQPAADGKTVRLWSQDHQGWLAMQATAEMA